MSIFLCEKHGKNIAIKIGKELREKVIKGEKVDCLVEILYEFEANHRMGFMFSLDEAEKFGIPVPGVIIRFNLDGEDDESENPFKIAEKTITIMCSKCFRELYSDLLENLAAKRSEYQEMWL